MNLVYVYGFLGSFYNGYGGYESAFIPILLMLSDCYEGIFSIYLHIYKNILYKIRTGTSVIVGPNTVQAWPSNLMACKREKKVQA